jgi:flagellar biosynthetic protein FliQ
LTTDQVISIGREAFGIVILVAAPCLGLSVVVGVLVSLFQATTQIHDQTLSFVPKILSVIAALFIFGGWMLRTVIRFTQEVIEKLPSLT